MNGEYDANYEITMEFPDQIVENACPNASYHSSCCGSVNSLDSVCDDETKGDDVSVFT